MKKKIIFISVLAAMTLMFTGCGTDENLVTGSRPSETKVSQTNGTDDEENRSDQTTVPLETAPVAEQTEEVSSDPDSSEQNAGESIEKATGVSVKALDGVWFGNNEYPDRLIISNGEYKMVNGYSKMLMEGKVKLEKAVSADGINKYSYNLYDNEGTLTESFEVTGEIPLNDLIPSMSDIKFKRDESGITEEPSQEDYAGNWVGPRPMISISGNNSSYEVKVTWGSSALETTVWTYPCEYDTTDKTLKCNGKGVKNNLVTDDSGNTAETTESTDCSAVFKIRYGVLTWEDQNNKDTAGYAFIKE